MSAGLVQVHSLVINPDKTNLTRSLELLGKEIKPVSVAKHLGKIIDSSLSYNEHMTKVVSDCMHRLIRINRIQRLYLDRKTLLSLINAFVFRKLLYCSTVLSKITISSELSRQDSSWSPEV